MLTKGRDQEARSQYGQDVWKLVVSLQMAVVGKVWGLTERGPKWMTHVAGVLVSSREPVSVS